MNGFDFQFLDQVELLIYGQHHQPHAFLGLHETADGAKAIRLWRPGAHQVFLEIFGTITEAKKVHDAGLFEASVPLKTTYFDYRVYHNNGVLAHDPYAFWPTFGELDQYLFGKGVHYQLYEQMGGRLTSHQGIEGVKFVVWAPNARRVALVADFNRWDSRLNPMRVLGYSGVWELFVPGLIEGEKYKFEIQTQQGEWILKADPYAMHSELRPGTASVIAQKNFDWDDAHWLQERKQRVSHPYPMVTYEVHLGSWRKKNGGFYNYRELAHQLSDYLLEMGFNYIELMPIQEHPLDESWGYQVSGFYAPTSRFGTPQDFKYFVNYLHQKGIGVILDWVPGHFPTDTFSIGRFDGSCLYEHSDPRQGFHPHWNTSIFNFGRHEVTNFLIANALYWMEEMHVDGLRVDAVASMIYLDYGRENGDWIPNEEGGKENLQAIEFMKHLNSVIHEKCPDFLMIAEESTSFQGITHPLQRGGLGFDLKWNMGWMNDTLRFFGKDTLYRTHHQNDLTFGLVYAFSERFQLVLSHDEVVHGKKSLLSKMPGDMWQQFANLRLLYSYMICQPGRKLLFMGGELGQWNEWDCKKELDWILLCFPTHQGIQLLVKDINHFYLHQPSFWEKEFSPDTFKWVDFNDSLNSVVSYIRYGGKDKLLCVHNFTAQYHAEYVLYFDSFNSIEEIFNTDNLRYGGSGKLNTFIDVYRGIDGQAFGIKIALAPLATMIFNLT